MVKLRQASAIPIVKSQKEYTTTRGISYIMSVLNVESKPSRTPTPTNKMVDVTDGTEPLFEKPPDGGLQAWLQVLGLHLTIFNTWYVFN